MSDQTPTPTRRTRRVRFAPAAMVAGIAGTAAIAMSMTGTLAALTASITNSNNTTATGTLTMAETNAGGTVTCTSTDSTTVSVNSATCSTINKYGGSTTMVPGASVSTTVKITNTGTIPANTFTLAPGTCTQGTNGSVNGNATDLCTKVKVAVTEQIGTGSTTTIVPAATLASLAGSTKTLGAPINAGAVVTYVFTVTLDSTAGNTYQGLSASQPLVWTFTS